MPGILLVFEGVEGCGKSTQARRLAEAFRTVGREVVETREPGGSELGDRIRDLLLSPSDQPMSAEAEMYLFAASRAEHVRRRIQPALARGAVVISDRFVGSSLAYQGGGRGLGVARVAAVNEAALAGLKPDLVFWLDLDVQSAARRAKARSGLDRIEAAGEGFHTRVSETFVSLAAGDPAGTARIDARDGEEVVAERVVAALRRHRPGVL